MTELTLMDRIYCQNALGRPPNTTQASHAGIRMQHLVERREQLDALLDATVRARDTAGEVALVYGEAGAGKTSLLAEFVSNLPHGSSYAWGSCDALHTPRPLGPLYDMAASFGPEFRTALNDPDRRADLFLAVTEAINRLGEGAVLIFEDTHWADLATLDLLKYLCRRILALKVLVIISYRNDEVTASHPLATLIGDLPARRVNRIEVPCLSLNGVREMAEQAGFTEKRLYELTGGNPFFLTEILTQPLGLETQLPRSVGATEWSAAKSPYDAAMSRLHYRGTNQADEMLVAIESLESIGANAAVHFARTLASECGLELATPKRRRGPYKASRSFLGRNSARYGKMSLGFGRVREKSESNGMMLKKPWYLWVFWVKFALRPKGGAKEGDATDPHFKRTACK